MATSKKDDSPTPAGGVRSEMFYMDDKGNPADESVATRCEIVEYDADGKAIQRTYGTLTPPKADK